MSDVTVSIDEFPAVLARDMAKLERRIKRAIERAARKSAKGVEKRTPKAFGELRDSIRVAEGPQIRVEAPHAAAVEIGSRPHWVPLDALVKWVKLRGMQGLDRKFSQRNANTPRSIQRMLNTDGKYGPTTREMARIVARELKKYEQNGSSPINAPEQVARAIQKKIAAQGTKPHFYVRGSLEPVVMKDLDTEIRKALGQ